MTVPMAHWLRAQIPGTGAAEAVAAARSAAALMGNATVLGGEVLVQGEGHLSLVLNHADSICAAVALLAQHAEQGKGLMADERE